VMLADLIREIAEIDAADILAVLNAITARLLRARPAPEPSSAAEDDLLLDADAAAKLLGVSSSWLYHRPKLPFRVKVGGKLKFRRSGIERWLRNRQG
jgi:predicted DNA-binding transcriptional regulator AlpA